MAVGKTKKSGKAGVTRKGGKKKLAVDPFTKKEWFDVKAPSVFKNRHIGKTFVNRTVGTKIASDSLRGRVFEVSLGDLNSDEDQAYKIMKLKVQDIQGKNCLTNFYGLRFSTDKIKSLIRKWQTMIQSVIDVKTTDGYILRVFAIAFTKKKPNQIKKNCYAQSAQVRRIRKRMFGIIRREITTCELKDVVAKLIPEVIGKTIEKQCGRIFPLQNCFIRQVKVIKEPRYDATKLYEIHGAHATEEVGLQVERPEEAEAQPQEPLVGE